tara:strand:- start:49 stop:495 length:447 start_codon:yes stop_codon:yes gene_type:complete
MVKEILNKFKITEKEFYERDKASFHSSKYASPNFVVAYGNEENYTEVLYFDGDGGRAIIKENSELFKNGFKIKLHECNYCDFEWSTIKKINTLIKEEAEKFAKKTLLELFDAYDNGEEYVYYNGKPCVYMSDGLWISKDGFEYDEKKG